MKFPRLVAIGREEFLSKRTEQIAFMKKQAKINNSIGMTTIVMDPKQEIVCDGCNALETGPLVFIIQLSETSERGTCLDCINKFWLVKE